jgi:hypothetical protein
MKTETKQNIVATIPVVSAAPLFLFVKHFLIDAGGFQDKTFISVITFIFFAVTGGLCAKGIRARQKNK